MLMQILLHTPKWVFAVFVLLAWLGGRQLVANRIGLNRVLRHQAAFALGVPALYGAFSGVFAARAARLWRLAAASGAMVSGARAA